MSNKQFQNTKIQNIQNSSLLYYDEPSIPQQYGRDDIFYPIDGLYQEESPVHNYNLESYQNFNNGDQYLADQCLEYDFINEPFRRQFSSQGSTKNENEMSQQPMSDENQSTSFSQTSNQELDQDISNLKKVVKKILSHKDHPKMKKKNARAYKIMLDFIQQFKSNTKTSSGDSQKNYPRDKNKYVFQILLEKDQNTLSDTLKNLDKQRRCQLNRLIQEIAKKGCWQKKLNRVMKLSTFQFQKQILEVMKSGSVQLMIERSRKDQIVKKKYLEQYQIDLEKFQRHILEKEMQEPSTNILSHLEYGY